MSPLRILFAFMFHRFDFVNSNSRHSRLKNVYRSVYSLLIELIPKPCQDKCLPFPWNRPTPLQAAPNDLDGSTVSLKDQDGALLEPIGTTKNIAGETIMQCTSLTSSLCNSFASIEFKIPKAGLTAGAILRHSKIVLEDLFAKHSPMIWKVGFTHNVAWRWGNSLYGYQHASDKWSNMVVLFETNEPYSPAMLEATLIDLYRSHWA